METTKEKGMHMQKALNNREVRAWLAGQKAVAERMRTERVSFLISLTPEYSLQIYLELKKLSPGGHSQAPSRLTWAMRRAIASLSNPQKSP